MRQQDYSSAFENVDSIFCTMEKLKLPEWELGKVEKLSGFTLEYIPLSGREGRIQRTSGNV